jgi:hypothetical protein
LSTSFPRGRAREEYDNEKNADQCNAGGRVAGSHRGRPDLYDIDIEQPSKEQKKSNIYKGRITRLEPSLEAAFVEYGGERHGFLPLKEISRDYFVDGVRPEQGHDQGTAARRPGSGGPGRQGRARQQGRCADHVHLAGRPLHGADAEQPARRRRLAPDRGRRPRRAEGSDGPLNIPEDMGVIIRTAGVGRDAEELQWDLDYLLQHLEGDHRRRAVQALALPDLPGVAPHHPRPARLPARRRGRDPHRQPRCTRTRASSSSR